MATQPFTPEQVAQWAARFAALTEQVIDQAEANLAAAAIRDDGAGVLRALFNLCELRPERALARLRDLAGDLTLARLVRAA
jgi:cytochrome P450